MNKQKLLKLLPIFVFMAIALFYYNRDSVSENREEISAIVDDFDNDVALNVGSDDVSPEDAIVPPSKEEALAMRDVVLEGMNEVEIDRLINNIKVANLQMEKAYLDEDIFGKLEDKNHLYWNYFEQKGNIQIDWKYDGGYSQMQKICKEENLTQEEFYNKYGTPVKVYNRYDARSFMNLLSNMMWSVENEALRNDIQYLYDETQAALETHDVEHVKNIYKVLHDMDYYLLRYGPEDEESNVSDSSIVSMYFGTLSVYMEE